MATLAPLHFLRPAPRPRPPARAQPELLNKQLVASDKFIVVASDGVWEFMTNQMVVDMTNEFKSPLKACKAVVQEIRRIVEDSEVHK